MLIGRSLYSFAAFLFVAYAAMASAEEENAVIEMGATRDPADLVHSIQVMTNEHPGQSGFYPLVAGIDALAARVLFAERAEGRTSASSSRLEASSDLSTASSRREESCSESCATRASAAFRDCSIVSSPIS